uniref:Uncharacterized protein n=1 Tax=Vespula pensylvanica TaxID=30213 RepID=A0A834P673_VESPE|nr:hypothetical protein H0235_006233 [Vespula pensylvanica]
MILPQNEAYRSSNKAVAQRGRPISSVRPVCELPTQCFVMRILAVGQAHFKWTYYIMSLANQCFVAPKGVSSLVISPSVWNSVNARNRSLRYERCHVAAGDDSILGTNRSPNRAL